MPRGIQWLGVVGPGVIVLGLSIGSGEFLLGPAVFVTARAGAAVGHVPLGVPADDFQHRADALHAGDRRAGVHRLHADAAVVDVLGVGLFDSLFPAGGLAGMGRERGRRGLLPVRAATGGSGRRGHRLSDRRRDVSRERRGAARRPAHRAHARALQLGAHRRHSQQLPRAGARLRPGAGLGIGARRPCGVRHDRRGTSRSCRRASTGFCSRR